MNYDRIWFLIDNVNIVTANRGEYKKKRRDTRLQETWAQGRLGDELMIHVNTVNVIHELKDVIETDKSSLCNTYHEVQQRHIA